MRWFLIPTLLFSVIVGGAARAEPTSNGTTYFDYGVFCALETVNTMEAEDTISGVVNLLAETPVFLKQTTVVPARIGVGFGVHVDIPPEFGNVAVLSMEHPPMGPNAVTHETWVSQYNAGQINYNGFTFEYDYELEPGVWTLSSSMNGRKIYEVEFNVIDASLMPGLTCDGAFLS